MTSLDLVPTLTTGCCSSPTFKPIQSWSLLQSIFFSPALAPVCWSGGCSCREISSFSKFFLEWNTEKQTTFFRFAGHDGLLIFCSNSQSGGYPMWLRVVVKWGFILDWYWEVVYYCTTANNKDIGKGSVSMFLTFIGKNGEISFCACCVLKEHEMEEKKSRRKT